ncbi:hypothetical protein BKA66DRAFT_93860 [Pyrenochaeta sp. MPI-SDFR-AT-0127]|nr:hypothetical protein BKA66DRAFT_93860 [Pyrenochaeta sp. MPI-SDFR-AT-0127]
MWLRGGGNESGTHPQPINWDRRTVTVPPSLKQPYQISSRNFKTPVFNPVSTGHIGRDFLSPSSQARQRRLSSDSGFFECALGNPETTKQPDLEHDYEYAWPGKVNNHPLHPQKRGPGRPRKHPSKIPKNGRGRPKGAHDTYKRLEKGMRVDLNKKEYRVEVARRKSQTDAAEKKMQPPLDVSETQCEYSRIDMLQISPPTKSSDTEGCLPADYATLLTELKDDSLEIEQMEYPGALSDLINLDHLDQQPLSSFPWDQNIPPRSYEPSPASPGVMLDEDHAVVCDSAVCLTPVDCIDPRLLELHPDSSDTVPVPLAKNQQTGNSPLYSTLPCYPIETINLTNEDVVRPTNYPHFSSDPTAYPSMAIFNTAIGQIFISQSRAIILRLTVYGVPDHHLDFNAAQLLLAMPTARMAPESSASWHDIEALAVYFYPLPQVRHQILATWYSGLGPWTSQTEHEPWAYCAPSGQEISTLVQRSEQSWQVASQAVGTPFMTSDYQAIPHRIGPVLGLQYHPNVSDANPNLAATLTFNSR